MVVVSDSNRKGRILGTLKLLAALGIKAKGLKALAGTAGTAGVAGAAAGGLKGISGSKGVSISTASAPVVFVEKKDVDVYVPVQTAQIVAQPVQTSNQYVVVGSVPSEGYYESNYGTQPW